MTKILKHAGVQYSLDLLISVKGQGINVKTNSVDCIADSNTIISADIKKPLVMKQGQLLVILVDSSHPRSERAFEATLISRHLLKKAKLVLDVPVAQKSILPQQGNFSRSSPWILSSDSARSELVNNQYH